MKKMLVVDGNSILNRAFYGVRPLTTKDGFPTNALYGMVNMIRKQTEATGADGLAVFGTLILGDGAYGVTEVNGGGLEIIVKQRGSSGAADPLDQRSSVGWKAIKTAELLIENYIVRIESVSKRFSASAKAN